MTTSDASCAPVDPLTALPTFELSYSFDDSEDPNLVTVFSEIEGETTTHWISAGIDDVVDLEDVA